MSYDLIVIGTGPGGYVCAIRAAQLGMHVAVVEKRATHGGTCLNIGCIPSKALLHTSEKFEEAGHTFAKLGIRVTPELDLAAMMAHKDAVVESNVTGIAYLFKKNKITAHHGTARLLGEGKVEVAPADGGEPKTLEGRTIVIATGSETTSLPGVVIDEKTILSSTGALALEKVPEHLLVIGAGVIGLELGSVWARLGARVSFVEYLDRILPGMDGEIAKQFQRLMEKRGFSFHLKQKVTGVTVGDDGKARVAVEAREDAGTQEFTADRVLVATGRRPSTEGLGLEALGIACDKRGAIIVDAHFKTSLEGIYAIGDVIPGPMLAHKAEEEGVALAEMLSGQAGHVDYNTIPGVVYTHPEIASVGKTEEELQAAGIAYRGGKFPFTANGRAKASLATDGFVKVLADATTDRVLGVHIIGANAGEIIHEAAVLMNFGGAAEDLARICHAHPTLSEAVKEAALAVDKRPIHI